MSKKRKGFKYYSPKLKPKNWVSAVSLNEYPYNEYTNHGRGGIKRGLKDLPKEEYPYKLNYHARLHAAYN